MSLSSGTYRTIQAGINMLVVLDTQTLFYAPIIVRGTLIVRGDLINVYGPRT